MSELAAIHAATTRTSTSPHCGIGRETSQPIARMIKAPVRNVAAAASAMSDSAGPSPEVSRPTTAPRSATIGNETRAGSRPNAAAVALAARMTTSVICQKYQNSDGAAAGSNCPATRLMPKAGRNRHTATDGVRPAARPASTTHANWCVMKTGCSISAGKPVTPGMNS